MNLYHDRQLYNTLIPPSHESPVVGLRISRLSGSVELTLRYTTPDIRCKHRWHECDGGIITDSTPGCASVAAPTACTNPSQVKRSQGKLAHASDTST